MAQIVLAFITPRAGEWNHRYIIPYGKSWNDTQIVTALQKLESAQGNRYGILKSATVQQQGGRDGTEKLFFYFENFNNLSSDEREKCSNLLEDWFWNERENMLQNVDWSKEGKTQVISKSELSKLYRNLENIANSKRIDSQEPTPSKAFNYKGCIIMIMAISIVALSLLFTAYHMEDGQTNQSIDEHYSSSNNTSSQKPASEPEERFSKADRETVERWFVWKSDKTEEKTDPEEYLNEENLMSVLDKIWPKEWTEKPETLDGLLSNLQTLDNSDKELVIFGPQDEKWEILRGIDPIKFHELLNMCRVWKSDLEYSPDNFKIDDNLYFDARFYWCSSDYNDAVNLREWLLDGIFTCSNKDKARKMKMKESSLKEILSYALKERHEYLKQLIDDDADEGIEKTEAILNLLREICEP